MKTLRNNVIVFAMMAMLPLHIFAQKPEKTTCFDEECVSEILEKMMSPNDSVAIVAYNTIIEMTDEAGMYHDSRMVSALKASMISFIIEGKNPDENVLLILLFPKFCWADDCRDLMKLTENELIACDVLRAIGDINGSGRYIENYIKQNHDNLKYKSALAYGVGKQHISSLEDELITWLKSADDNTKIEIYNALMVVKSSEKTTKIIEKGAKKLYKSKISSSKIAGMRLLTTIKGKKALPLLYKALQNNDCDVRREALELLKPFVNQEVVNTVVQICNTEDAVLDIVMWLGEIKNDSQMPLIIRQLSSNDPQYVEAAIRSVFLIDNAEGINAVKPMFGGVYQNVIKESMLTYEGDYRAVLDDVMQGNDQQKLAGLQIVECRPIKELNLRVRELVFSDNQEIRDEAYKVLKLVVVPGNMEFLKELINFCKDQYVEDVQMAMINALGNASADSKDSFVLTLKYVRPEIMPRYYKVFAYFGTELCVDKLIDAYTNGDYKEEAREALLLVEDKQFEQKIQEVLK